MKIEKFDHLFHRQTVLAFFRAHRWKKQQALQDIGPSARMSPDKEIGKNRGMVEQFDILESARDTVGYHLIRTDAGNILSIHDDLSIGRVIETRNQIEDRRLACPVRPDNREDLTLIHLEGYIIDSTHTAEILGQVFCNQQAHRIRSVFR